MAGSSSTETDNTTKIMNTLSVSTPKAKYVKTEVVRNVLGRLN